MTLKEYLEKNKISIENAAKDLGFSYEDKNLHTRLSHPSDLRFFCISFRVAES